ncbi:hypothetical protein SAMN05519104_4930 [Rhizobiales bacterium GAS188]|nr:hypothetical protein SAMN05519104_4930 [Rhizobiales bacterium GAS188]
MSHVEDQKSARKPFVVMQEDGRAKVLASFDSLEKAVAFARLQRLDRKHFVRHKRRIVWPEGFQLVRRRKASMLDTRAHRLGHEGALRGKPARY